MTFSRFRSLTHTFGFIGILVLLGACDSPEERALKYIDRGVALFDSGDHARARIEFANAAKIDGTNGVPFYYIGRIHEAKNEFRPAFGSYLKAVQQSPNHVDASLRLGRMYLLANNQGQARDLAEKVIALEPRNAEAFALRGAISLHEKKPEEAKADALQALKLDPANTNGRAVLVGYHRARKDNAAALKVLTEGIALKPKEASFYIMKVALHVARKEVDQVEAGLRALLGLDPTNANYRLSLARFYVSRRKPDAAQAILKEAINLNPQDTKAKLRYVVFLANQRGIDAAEYTLKEFMGQAKDDYTFHLSLADLYNRNNRRNEAKAVLEETIAKAGTAPHGLRAKVALAQFRYSDKDIAGSLALLNDVLTVDRNNGAALLTRARIWLRRSRFKDAILDLRTYLRDNPRSRQALTLLSRAYQISNQHDLAIDSYRRLLSVDQTDNRVRLQLAQLIARKGDRDAAIKLLNDGLAKTPNNQGFLATKADIQISLRHYEGAQSIIEKLGTIPEAALTALKLQGRLAIAQRRFPDAVVALNKVLQKDQKSLRTVSNLARVHLAMKRADLAEKIVEKYTKNNPRNALAKLLLGDIYSRQNKFDAAIKVYNSIADNPRTGANAFVRLARVYRRLENPAKSIEALKFGLMKNPKNWNLSVLLVLTLQRERRVDEALALYGKMLDQRPESLFAANNYAALVADHRFEDKKALERAIKAIGPFQATENPLLLDTIGWLQMRNKDVSEALVYLRRAIGLAPNHPVINYHIAVAYRAINKSDLARTHVERALKSSKTFDEVEKARALLAELPSAAPTGTNPK